MSVLKGVITNEGLSKSIEAAHNEGWHIYPKAFEVSENVGLYDVTRDYASMEATWYRAPISSRIVKSINTIEFICEIPPQQTASEKYIRELYVIAEDNNGVEFLLAFCAIDGDAEYDPAGSTKFRVQISIQNLNMTDLYVFKYTQAQEVADHNVDPNAHQDIRKLVTGAVQSVTINNNYYANMGDTIFVDSRTNAVYIDLPNTKLQLGTRVTVMDVGKACNYVGKEIVVRRNGEATIDNIADDFQIDMPGAHVDFFYNPTRKTWMLNIGGRFYGSFEGPIPNASEGGTANIGGM